VSYKDLGGGVELLRKETIDDALSTLEGIPLTIDHVTLEQSADPDVANGRGYGARFNAEDGWYWCDTTVDTDQARSRIRCNQTPSVAFEVLEWGPAGVWQNLRYDREIKKIRFNHLAIVQKPRYTESKFRLNAAPVSDPMNVLKLIRNLVTRENGADIKKSETIEVSGLTQVEIDGQNVRLNDLGKLWMEQTKAAVTATSGDDELEIDGCKVRMNDLVECYRNSRKNAGTSDDNKKDEKKEAGDEGKGEPRSNGSPAPTGDKVEKGDTGKDTSRTNAGTDAFFKLSAAAASGARPTYSTSSGSLQERTEVGKKRY
jgi:hypothetical protein